ncbi:kinase-like domain-containing protein [Lentinula raphanica]|nr:kinase-like domain-containing protein [Lentinula raphanica]
MSAYSLSETNSIFTSTGTFTSSSTIPGLGYLSSKAFERLGSAVVNGVDAILIRRRIAQIEDTLGFGPMFDSVADSETDAIKLLYSDLLELSRTVYSHSIRERAFRVIMSKIGVLDFEYLAQAMVDWPLSESYDLLNTMMDCLRPDSSHSEAQTVLNDTYSDAKRGRLHTLPETIPLRSFAIAILLFVALSAALSSKPSFSRIVITLQLLPFIVDLYPDILVSTSDRRRSLLPAHLTIHALIEKLDPDVDFLSISQLKDMLEKPLNLASDTLTSIRLAISQGPSGYHTLRHAGPSDLPSHLRHTLQYVTHGRINKKYGKWGRVLGSGADGKVRLIEPSHNKSSGGNRSRYAVKKFRPKRKSESEKEYQKKVIAEFCVESTLKHPNIIKTVDLISENGHYYKVMEYAPYDLFSVVMSGKMCRPEIYCVFRQICEGVEYLHSLGLAHRNLKLDNCVITADNVVKIINFGTATVFHYPGRTTHTKAKGLVGSDAYPAPELLRADLDSDDGYDPRKTDVWSVAAILISMLLRRFPWKIPDVKTDPSFRTFVDAHPDLQSVPKSETSSSQEESQPLLELGLGQFDSTVKPRIIPNRHDHTTVSHESGNSVADTTNSWKDSERPSSTVELDQDVSGSSTRANTSDLSLSPSSPSSSSASADYDENEDGISKDEERSERSTGPGAQSQSLFLLLPQETRPALRRMMHLDPSTRCTLTDLLKGRGKHDNLLCGCGCSDPDTDADSGFLHTADGDHDASTLTLTGPGTTIIDGHGARGDGEELDQNTDSSFDGDKVDKVADNSSTAATRLSMVHQFYCVYCDCEPEEEDDGDPWLTSIVSCSAPGVLEPDHVHVKAGNGR